MFSNIYLEITSFLKEHLIDPLSISRRRRIGILPPRFKDVFITTNVGHRINMTSEDQYRKIFIIL